MMTNVDINLTPDMKSEDFDYNSIEAGYYDRVFHKRAGSQSKWHHLKFAPIRDRIGATADHLDIACGPGTFIGTIGQTVESTGVDIAASQIDYARAAYGSERKNFDIVKPGELPYGDSTFDVATCVEVVAGASISGKRRSDATRGRLWRSWRRLRPVLVKFPGR